ncbi:MAG: hypothetical protein K6E59_06205 [Bacilli bacterium]|nr:hypothetical protein [Bacilli bacterium]
MLLKTSIRPYRSGDGDALNAFLSRAKFLLGNVNFEEEGKFGLYLLCGEGVGILGLVEAQARPVVHLEGATPALVITKLALDKDCFDEDFIRSLLLYVLVQARQLNVPIVLLEGEEVPFEKELGFRPAAQHGIYDEKHPNLCLESLRLCSLGEDPLKPGFLR